MKHYYLGIEGGGTKFNILFANSPSDILSEGRIETSSPDPTMNSIKNYLLGVQSEHEFQITSAGIGCFGPLDLNPNSITYGSILSTPKKGWQDFNILARLEEILNVDVFIDTDVNCSALGEGLWGSASGISNFLYLTIGTGIGGGVVLNGQVVHGKMHPEMGHVFIPYDKKKDPFPGVCPFHGDCFEGLASGPAIEKRWGKPAKELPPEHPAWELEANYIAYALATYTLTFSPEKIILGGGVMQQGMLYTMVSKSLNKIINNYLPKNSLPAGLDEFICPPALGDRAGTLGAIALAKINRKPVKSIKGA